MCVVFVTSNRKLNRSTELVGKLVALKPEIVIVGKDNIGSDLIARQWCELADVEYIVGSLEEFPEAVVIDVVYDYVTEKTRGRPKGS